MDSIDEGCGVAVRYLCCFVLRFVASERGGHMYEYDDGKCMVRKNFSQWICVQMIPLKSYWFCAIVL